jgi:Protein of unknown function (DUF1553)/Protein of unknown function (DUF1549)/Planctomycete cytochrome C
MRLLAVTLLLIFVLPALADDPHVLFERSVKPILADKCIQCHGPDESKREANLRLDVASEEPEQREVLKTSLIERLISTDPDFQMPPPALGKPLSASEIGQLKQWVDLGAPFSSHWAYRPIERFDTEAEGGPTIDSLVEQGLNELRLEAAPQISSGQWLRRAYIDLIGIPPTWEEQELFAKEDSISAQERVVDRLLSSTAYGQRWGKYWLDLARYADTHGGAAIGFASFPYSYTYRDYVIQAFNDDRPYDQFIVEQIAADQMGLEPNDPRLAALGFLTVGMQFRNRHDTLDDQIDVVTRGLMGLTVACARCHDHKFDAIPTRDYYAIYAALSSSSPPDELPAIEEPVVNETNMDEATKQAREAYFKKLESLKIQHSEMARDQVEVMKHRIRMQFGMYLREIAKGTPEQDVSTGFLSYRTDDIRPVLINRWRSYLASLPADDAVFGIWHQLSSLPAEDFAAQAQSLLEARSKENPDPSKANEYHALGASAPPWNPLVIEALSAKKPTSMLDVADAFGELFARVHQDWLQAILETSLEAVSSDTVVPDEDAKHLIVNSPVYRQIRRHLYGAGTPTDLPDEIARQLLNRTIEDSLSGKRGAIEDLHRNDGGAVPRAMSLNEDPSEQDSFVFLRGNHLTRGERVKPGFLSVVSGGTSDLEYQPGKRRLALARAILSKNNPLTRRVIVNWVWQQHFGQGLVRTTDDFGTRGTPPSNPRLLDYLADTFEKDGWSLKRLHRRILLSDTYRRASIELDASRRIDPENGRLWRMPRRRMDFEAMRDSMLSVSGELDSSLGGRPIDLGTNPAIPRRSVYGFVNRDIVSNLASTFDSANPNSCTLKRPDTVVPQQTLFALNSEFIQERAAKIASLMKSANLESDSARIEWLYRRIYSRLPTADEVEMATRYVESKSPGSASADRMQSLAHVLLASNEFLFVD